MAKAKILVGIPGYNGVQPEAQENVVGMMFRCGREMPEYDFGFKVVWKKEQFRARNQLVDMAIGGGFDYLLMLDDDMLVPSDLVKQLIAHDKDVVGALYFQRGGAYHPVIIDRVQFPDSDQWRIRYHTMFDDTLQKPGLYKVDIIGGGCMLFKTDVFRKLIPPYFWWESQMGTDVHICSRLKDEANVSIYIDSSIELGHLGDKPIVSRKTLPKSMVEKGAMLEQLWADAKSYFGMSNEELSSKMLQAVSGDQRKTHWQERDRSTWEGVRDYYTSNPEWNILNLLYFPFQKNDFFVEWALVHAPTILPKNAVVLDLGPGIGDKTLPLAAKHGYRVYAADIEKASTLDFLTWRAERHGLTGTSTRCVIPWTFSEEVPERDLPEQVDCVLMCSMIEHLTQPFATLEWVSRQMKPGGILICDYAAQIDEDEPQHLMRYDPATFNIWMNAHGWRTSVEYPWMFVKKEN